MKRMVSGILMTCTILTTSFVCQAEDTALFSVTIPEEIQEIALVESKENTVALYEPIAHEKTGGFIASITAYECLADYANHPEYERGGVLTGLDGKQYDIVIEYPTDVQFDPKDEESVDRYKSISEAVAEIVASLVPVEGYCYTPQDSVDTTGIYKEVLIQLKELLDSNSWMDVLSEAGFSYLYQYYYNLDQAVQDLIGYAFLDVNGDGYDELFIGAMDDEFHIIFDMFAQVDQKVCHIFSSGERDRYMLLDEYGNVMEEGSDSASESFTTISLVESNQKELCKQVSVIYSEVKNEKNPYFLSYGEEAKQSSEEECKEILENWGETYSLQYQALSTYQNQVITEPETESQREGEE